jgi:AraC family transcriptional regulator
MQRSHIATRDPQSGNPVRIVEGATTVWSSGERWGGVVVELHRVERADTPEFYIREHTVILHRSPTVVIELKRAGEYRRQSVAPGEVSLISAGMPLQVRHGPKEQLVMALTPEFVAQVVDTPNAAEPLFEEQHAVNDRQIVHIAKALETEAKAGYPSGRVYGEALGAALVAHLIAQYSAPRLNASEHTGGMSPCALRRVMRYIDEHLTEEIRIDDLARVAGLSHHRFAHNFKRTTGLPPLQYVIHRRVECAKPLLRDTDNTVANLTYELGFGSPSRFAFLFRRETGMTPTRYRAMFR